MHPFPPRAPTVGPSAEIGEGRRHARVRDTAGIRTGGSLSACECYWFLLALGSISVAPVEHALPPQKRRGRPCECHQRRGSSLYKTEVSQAGLLRLSRERVLSARRRRARTRGPEPPPNADAPRRDASGNQVNVQGRSAPPPPPTPRTPPPPPPRRAPPEPHSGPGTAAATHRGPHPSSPSRNPRAGPEALPQRPSRETDAAAGAGAAQPDPPADAGGPGPRG